MGNVYVQKRGKVYQYQFAIASIDGKRKYKNKSGFKTKSEAIEAGVKAYNEYINVGHCIEPSKMSYSDYLDYWMKEHCEINLKYHTIQAYQNIMKNHIKPKLGFYMLSQLTTSVIQEFINNIYLEKGFSKNFLKNILKVLKGSLGYAKYDIPDSDPVYILSNEEVEKILERFSNNRCVYYAFLTAYYTGLRVSEVFGLTWDDIDFAKRTITVNKNILKKNQAGGTKNRLISGNSTTVWYFGTCKTKGSYRTIEIGDTLLNALKQYKEEQIQNRKDYGDIYMKHYKKIVNNPYNNKPEIKIINAYAELEVPLEEVKLVFLKKNGVFEGTDSCKYPFKVIHYELGIPCRFHDFRDTHATRLIEAGADIKAVSKRLGHSNIRTTYEIYVKVTTKMESDTVEKFESIGLNLT